MTCIADNRRPGKLVVDWTDAAGKRHWRTFPKSVDGRRQARIFAGECDRLLIRGEPGQDEKITFKEATDRWLLHCKASLTFQTYQGYAATFANHVLPRFASRPLVKVTRSAFKLYVSEMVASDTLQRSTIGTLVGTVRAFFAYCVEEGLVLANPAATVIRALKLERRRKDTVKAMSREQLSAFLGTAQRVLNEDEYLELLILARTGVRMGECHGLQWGDFLDEEPPRLRVERQVTQHALIRPPKTEKGRRLVDMPSDLQTSLREAWARRQETRLRHGVVMGVWISHPEWPEEPDKAHVKFARRGLAHRMAKVITTAALPHFTPHGLRHTHATLLLLQREPVQYVQQQLGHATVGETVDTYGSWIQAESQGAAQRLADRTQARESAVVGAILKR